MHNRRRKQLPTPRPKTSRRSLLLASLLLLAVLIFSGAPNDSFAAEPPATSAPATTPSADAKEAKMGAQSSAAKSEDGAGANATTFTEAPDGGESVSGLKLMVAAYIAMWVLLLAYLTSLFFREKKIGTELEELNARITGLESRINDQPQ